MILRRGDKGEKVMQLQSALIGIGIPLPRYGVDGIFGSETEQAVKQAQQTYGLQPTGVADISLLSRFGLIKKAANQSQEKAVGGGLWALAALAIIGAGIAIKKATKQ